MSDPQLEREREIDEPLPDDSWRPKQFRGLCLLCGTRVQRPGESLCDQHADLQYELDG